MVCSWDIKGYIPHSRNEEKGMFLLFLLVMKIDCIMNIYIIIRSFDFRTFPVYNTLNSFIYT